MRLASAVLFVGSVSQGMVSLQAAPAVPDTANGPAAVLARAWPLYDFTSSAVKPWHLKASYLVYDAEGKNPAAGVYEYWWASPALSRSTWLRAGLKHTDWHLGEGKLAYEASGNPLSLFEYKLESALLAPLPRARDLDPDHFRLAKEEGGNDASGESCFSIIPRAGTDGAPAKRTSAPPQMGEGPYPTYCFEADEPVLRSVYSFERVLTQFSNVRKTQGRYLARGIAISAGDRKLLTATVDVVEPIGLEDAALKPPVEASRTEVFVSGDVGLKDVDVDKDVAQGMLLKKTEPVYPPEARNAGIQGKVVLEATIGTDGKIHDLRVISAPAAALAAASFAAVWQWEYRPYLMQGRAVPVQTTISVTFSLDREVGR